MSIPEERYVEISRPGETSGGANSGEVRDLKRRLDQHIGSGGQAHAVATETSAGFMSSDDKAKINGIQNEATKNMPDDYLLARGNHTGVQAIETINGLREELNELGGAELEELVAQAEAAADEAEAARDAAFVNADVYPDVATGRAAVADGEQFQVVEDEEIVRYRRDSSSSQTEVARYPSSAAVLRPEWVGLKEGWADTFFRHTAPGTSEEWLGRSRWGRAGTEDFWEVVDNPLFDGQAFRRTVVGSVGAQFSGIKIYLDDLGHRDGDSVTVRGVFVASVGSVIRMYVRPYSSSGSPLTASSSGDMTATSAVAVASLTVTPPTGTEYLLVTPTLHSGSDLTWAAAWASIGETPMWPLKGDTAWAVAAAEYAGSRQTEGVNLEGAYEYAFTTFTAVEGSSEIISLDGTAFSSIPRDLAFSGSGERFSPAGVSFNAVEVVNVARVPEATALWRTLNVVVRTGVDSHLADSDVVAVGSSLVPMGENNLSGIKILLRDPSTGDPITLNDASFSGGEYFIGVYARTSDGGPAAMGEANGTFQNSLGQSYWLSTGNPISGNWGAGTSNRRQGTRLLLIDEPFEAVAYQPSPALLEDISTSIGSNLPPVPDRPASYGRELLRSYLAKTATIVGGSDTLQIAVLGSSSVNWPPRMVGPLRSILSERYDLRAPGYIAANTSVTVAPGGSRVSSGWTNVTSGDGLLGPDTTHVISDSDSATISFGAVEGMTSAVIHYYRQPGGGSFSWRDGLSGMPTVVSTDGAAGHQYVEVLEGGSIYIDVTDQGSAGVVLFGVDVRNDEPGTAVIHKLGSGGARTARFLSVNYASMVSFFTQLQPDLLIIQLGTNDLSGTSRPPEDFANNMAGIADRVLVANPLCDVLMVLQGPASINMQYTFEEYGDALYEICRERGFAFLDLNRFFGSFEEADARGMFEDLVHPSPDGGKAIGRVVSTMLIP